MSKYLIKLGINSKKAFERENFNSKKKNLVLDKYNYF